MEINGKYYTDTEAAAKVKRSQGAERKVRIESS